ncbi:putative maleylacetoacetate isomerase 1 [Glandiceps talaboti]
MTTTDKAILYHDHDSSCSRRVLIALLLKEIDHEVKVLTYGEDYGQEVLELNPMGQIPFLIIDGNHLSQSLAMIEYLEETRDSGIRLLPTDPIQRAQVRQISDVIVSGIQPLQNKSTPLIEMVGADKLRAWLTYWIDRGCQGLEKMLVNTSGKYCVGDQVTMADICLAPQVYNASSRYNVDMSKFPTIVRINAELMKIKAFYETNPANYTPEPK